MNLNSPAAIVGFKLMFVGQWSRTLAIGAVIHANYITIKSNVPDLKMPQSIIYFMLNGYGFVRSAAYKCNFVQQK